jgi:hypothetical protein
MLNLLMGKISTNAGWPYFITNTVHLNICVPKFMLLKSEKTILSCLAQIHNKIKYFVIEISDQSNIGGVGDCGFTTI